MRTRSPRKKPCEELAQDPTAQHSKTGRLSLRVPACASELSDDRSLAKVETLPMPAPKRIKHKTTKVVADVAPSLVDRGMSNTRMGVDPPFRSLTRRRHPSTCQVVQAQVFVERLLPILVLNGVKRKHPACRAGPLQVPRSFRSRSAPR